MARAYSLDLRERAVEYVLDGGSKDDACRIFKIARDTLYRWLKQHRETGSLKAKPLGSRPWKLDHAAIAEYVKDNNDNTLEEYAAQFNTVPSAIDYVLRKQGITRKKNHAVHRARRGKRKAFLAEIAELDPRKIIYIDESGVEDTLHRNYAGAPRGEQVLADILGHKTKRISIIAGLLGHKLIAPFRFEGYTDAEVFNTWPEHGLLSVTPPGYTLIMDRASFHRNAKTRQLIVNLKLNSL